MTQSYPHQSVMLEEVLQIFADLKIKTFVDGTLGAGGHSAAILAAHPECERLIGLDQDESALAIAKTRLSEKATFVHSNFAQLPEVLAELGIDKVDGILLDLGVSSMQLDQAERGFSFMRDGPLDMRMDPTAKLSAYEVVNFWSERELARIIRDYGEERHWRACARDIVAARKVKPIETTLELCEALKGVLKWQGRNIHPCTLVFQGIRIAVNSELDVLSKVLPACIAALKPGGRLCVLSFHSLEDGLVKNAFKALSGQPLEEHRSLAIRPEAKIRILTKKPMLPDMKREKNPRASCVKLRACQAL